MRKRLSLGLAFLFVVLILASLSLPETVQGRGEPADGGRFPALHLPGPGQVPAPFADDEAEDSVFRTLHSHTEKTGPGQRIVADVPVINLRDFGYTPIDVPIETGPSSGALQSPFTVPHAVLDKVGSSSAPPGAAIRYEVTLANYESVTHTYRLTDTLPPQLAYVPDSASGLTYDAETRVLTWQGTLAPGHLDAIIAVSSVSLPYLDLAAFGAANLCDDFIADGEGCDDVAVIFNVGTSGYTATLYGQAFSQLTLSSNGVVLGGASPAGPLSHNRPLPHPAAAGPLLAGLWRDVDLTEGGRWHAAIISGLVVGRDVFYAQWHDAPHAANSDLTARHAIAVVLDGADDAGDSLRGSAFFIYDNVADPAGTAARGYTLGAGDKLGVRGVTHAYAPCCGDAAPPQGFPPPAGTTLHVRPVLFGAGNEYARTFSYRAVVAGRVPETVANTVVATSSSADPALAHVWDTHYLYVRLQTYLPTISHAAAE